MSPRVLHIVRILRIAAVALLGVLAVLVILVLGVFYTSPGTALAIRVGLAFAPKTLRIDRVTGTFASPLELGGVRFENEMMRLSVARLRVRWRPWALLGRELHVDTLLVDRVDLVLRPDGFPPPDTTQPKPEPGEPPLRVVFDDLHLRSSSLEWPKLVTVSALEATMRGNLDAYALQVGAAMEGPQVPRTTVELSGRGSLDQFTLTEAIAHTLGGVARARGKTQWAPDLTWSFELSADSLKPALMAPQPEEWPGWLGLRVRTEGRIADDRPTGWAPLDTLTGSLRERPLAGSARCELGGDEVGLSRALVTWGGARFSGSGRMGNELHLDLALDVPDLGEPLPRAAGRARAAAKIDGPAAAPRVEATFEAADVAFDTLGLGHLDGRGDVDLTAQTARLSVALDRLRAGSQGLDSVRVSGTATADALELAARVEGPELGLALVVAGDGMAALMEISKPVASNADTSTSRPNATGWHGEVRTLDLRTKLAGDWSLRVPAGVFASADSGALGDLCLVSGDAAVCASGSWTAIGRARVRSTVTALPLALARPYLPESTDLEGQLGLDLDLSLAPDSTFAGFAELVLAGTTLLHAPPQGSTSPVRLSFAPLRMRVEADGRGILATAAVGVLDSARVPIATFEGTMTLPGFHSLTPPAGTQAVAAHLMGEARDLSFVNAFLTDATGIAGRLGLDVTAGGTIASPEIQGGLKVAGGKGTIPALGLSVQDVALDVTHERERGLALTGRARSGEGQLALEGDMPLVPSSARPGRLTVRGERFQVMNTPEAKVVASPDLAIVFTADSVDVRGEVVIPEARIELIEVPEFAVPPSQDVVYVDADSSGQVLPFKLSADVKTTLGEKVFFRGFGFASFLEGALRITQTPGSPPSGSGELVFREGHYRAYGQDLTIEQGLTGRPAGRLMFAGPLDNPAIDMRAYRTAIDGTEAGLAIKGRIQTPAVEVYSDPVMAQADALSYVLLGRPMNEESSAERASVASAAATVGGSVLATQLASKVGIDEASIEGGESGSLQDASLVVGKYLSPTLYASYGMGLFDRVSKFRMRYLFSQSMSVQTESGTATGADLLFRIQRGGQGKAPATAAGK